MEAALLAVVAGLFLASDKPRPDASSAKLEEAAEKIVSLARFAKGRVLGSLVREGMPQEEVSRILGHECGIFLSPSMCLYSYYNLGVNVFYRLDEKGIVRVERVTFWPLYSSDDFVFVTILLDESDQKKTGTKKGTSGEIVERR